MWPFCIGGVQFFLLQCWPIYIVTYPLSCLQTVALALARPGPGCCCWLLLCVLCVLCVLCCDCVLCVLCVLCNVSVCVVCIDSWI